MPGRLHLIKLCVGATCVEDLADWQARVTADEQGRVADPRPLHVTRMWPRRASDLLAGGSLYWVIKGLVLARQNVVELEAVTGADGVRRCGVRLDPLIVRTFPQPRRPFQGWRYLRAADAPRDRVGDAPDLPPALAADLAALGVL